MSAVELLIRNLRKAYGSREVLSGLDFTLCADGGICGLFGPNGAGKTTLFRCILGLESCHADMLRWCDTDLGRLPPDRIARAGVTVMFQQPVALDGLTVEGQLALLMEERFGRLDAERLERLLEGHRLGTLRHQRVKQLSFGEAKLVDFARVMMLEPSLLLLDEPFSGVDPLHIDTIKAQVRAVASKDRAVLLTDHNLHQALDFVDHAHILYEGRLLFSGTPQQARADPGVRSLYLGQEN